MSDDDLRDIGLTSNAVGQLRNIVKGQTTNGLSQLAGDKKVESPSNSSNLGDQIENEVIITCYMVKLNEVTQSKFQIYFCRWDLEWKAVTSI